MKAMVYASYGGPEVLTQEELPVPEPAPGQVRVKVLACAVNLSDWEYLTGSPAWVRTVAGLFRPKIPVLGSDIVGIVDAVAADVTEFAVGDRVMGDYVMTRGGFAEYARVPVAETIKVPDALSDDVAAALPQAGGIAVSGTDGIGAGTRLLINGSGGGSGTMALQLAKAAGAHVTAVDNAGKIGWLKHLGADEVIDYAKTDFTQTGQRWDRILDMVATRPPRALARALLPGGTYRALGGTVPVLLSLLIGGWLFHKTRSIGMLLVPSGRDLTTRVAQAAVEGRIAPHIEAVLPMADVPEALARTGQGKVKGKIVIRPDA